MNKGLKVFLFFAAAVLLSGGVSLMLMKSDVSNAQERTPDRLVVVWTSADKDVAVKMVYMYTLNAKKQGWFDEVRFVVWGPSAKLLSEDTELQEYLGRMKEAGVELQACIACANMYGVTDKLRALGIEVKGMGKPLTEMLKSDWKTITF